MTSFLLTWASRFLSSLWTKKKIKNTLLLLHLKNTTFRFFSLKSWMNLFSLRKNLNFFLLFQTYSSGSFYHHPQSAILYEHALRRQSKGTGVFIPQSTQPRRKHRKGRSSSNAKHQKQSPVPIKKPVSNPKMVADTYMSSQKTA